MEKIYTCNRLESLCQTLAENIRNSERQVFAKEVIITQSGGMNAWLKTELAQRNGVIANFEFQNQDGLLSEIYQFLFKERLQNNFDSIKYKIYDGLDSFEFKDTFAEVANYYHNDDLRRFQLADKIADLFDQYQLYRPEMIENWDHGNSSTENQDERLQKWLWQKLGIESRAKIKLRIIDQLDKQRDLIRKTYPVISLFGITVYTLFHRDFFRELAKYIQVNFYLCLPTDQLPFQNELLISYGSKAAELARMFAVTEIKSEANGSDTLLSRIQNQILQNKSDLNWTVDDSLQINSCYTPVREAECLYNYLLDLFEKDQTLRPRDVLVMTTDINKYAPYIKAVFRNAPVNIPFQVSGTANNSDDSIVAALEQILNFREEDLTSEKVISLLEQKRIKQRFGVQDCNYIRSVVRKANIRFGRENRAEDDTQYVSWKYGLDKILLGYAMLTDDEYPIGGNLTVYPFKDSEASASYDLFRLKAFVEMLESVIDAQKETKTLADWKLFLLNEVIGEIVYCDDFNKNDRAELNSVYRALLFADQPEFDNVVSFSVFLDELKTKLFTESRESKLNTGRITVSSPIPVRGLPFKVICFLGLNNDIFPRKDRFMGFDLLGEKYLDGDRNIKETDKYLFLDTILASREKLYLSYIGQSVKDNTEIPPSIVIDTLLDYMGQENFVVKHPLHGFSSRYSNPEDNRIFTYLYSKEFRGFSPKPKTPEELTEVSVYSFVKFFEHPIEWYFNNILGIKYENKADTLPENELFELDHLQKWQIKNDILRKDEKGIGSYLDKGIKEGLLPLKNLGKLVFDELVEETETIRDSYRTLTEGKEERVIAIDLIIGNIQITGLIPGVFDNQYITCSLSNTSEKNRIRAYLKTLMLCTTKEIEASLLINADGTSISLPIFSPEEAKLKLEELLIYLKMGMELPLKFTIKATQPPTKTAGISMDSVIKAFQAEANGNPNKKPPTSENKYLKKLFEEDYFKSFDQNDFDELKRLTELLTL